MGLFDIRPVSAQEFVTAIDWAAAEGWNPGLEDLIPFHSADPEGFIMGFLDGEPISSISVVRYGTDYGFLGFYIVKPEFRGKEYGLKTWNAGMEHLEGRIIGLDGVVDQQENYRKSGFVLTGRNIRHTGVPIIGELSDKHANVQDIDTTNQAALVNYDRNFVAVPRNHFIEHWTKPDASSKRGTKISVEDGNINGYGTLRECREGYKIGPLFAEDEKTAEALFCNLVSTAPAGSEISLDTPEDNTKAVRLAVRYGMKPVFETARMYKGDAPNLPLQKIFGVTTFELG